MDELELEGSPAIALTAGGHARLQAELARLTVDKRQEIAERIRASKDHGEYSEDNNELDEVKLEQAIVETRIAELKAILSEAVILNMDDVPTDYVGLGSKVSLEDAEGGVKFVIQLVASVEANADEDLISEESPLGQAVMGCRVGDVAQFEAPAGRLKYKITKITK